MNARGARLLIIQKFGQTKVKNLDLAGRGDHDVSGFDVAMDDAARVRHRERIGNLDGNQQRALQFQRMTID